MPEVKTEDTSPKILLPDASIVVLDAKNACRLTPDGEITTNPIEQTHLKDSDLLVCHAPYTAQRLNIKTQPRFDVLELFAFVCPDQFSVPTPQGIARTIGVEMASDLESQAMGMLEVTQRLLEMLWNDPRREDLINLARYMDHWAWSGFILNALGVDTTKPVAPVIINDIAFWKNLPKWEESAPKPDPTQNPISPEDASKTLENWLQMRPNAEKREAQFDYTKQLTQGFDPIDEEGKLKLVLSEAGTGVGKTLGYLAPSKLWSDKNDGSVWVSTYTKNLQTQILQEGDRIDLDIHARKGRENYLCLLNLQDSVKAAATSTNPQDTISAGLMLRWIMATKDGDLTGAGFPGWLMGLLGVRNSLSLGDRRGECIHSACDHYQSCFIEHAIRKSKDAKLVVSNHALVMYLSALGGTDDALPTRFVFDEGHHLFDAADSAYAAHLSGRETSELRRWLLGAEQSKRSRARGLSKRLEGLTDGDDDAQKHIQKIMHHARALPPLDWARRIKKNDETLAPTENFLRHVAGLVRARNDDQYAYYSLETAKTPVSDVIDTSARELIPHYKNLLKSIQALSSYFKKKLDNDAEELNADTRKRMAAIIQSLQTRGELQVMSWISMLEQISTPTPPDFVDWFNIDRIEGRDIDVGMYRHWVDPMIPFTANMRSHTHGLTVTSATLRDDQGDWDTALTQTGLHHFDTPVDFFAAPSPFNYAKQAKILVVNDLRKNALEDVITGYRELMLASGGGALGIFTAIKRLKDVQKAIKTKLAENAIPLYAQHIDDMDIGTMIDIFREEENACLLGTDAVRDGVDVPGNSLRMIIFDRVPWPRPNILHKARRNAFGGKEYDERLTRLKLKQAFGRLIRSQNDKGVFVVLDGMLPTRLLTAFPNDIDVQRIGLKEAIEVTRDFLHK